MGNTIYQQCSGVRFRVSGVSKKDKALLFRRKDIVESALCVNKNVSQHMVLKKCGMAERVVHGCKKRGAAVITY